MTLDLQFRIKNNPNYEKYLREHSYWYKYLNRDPSSFNKFEMEAKEFFKLRPTDKLERILNGIEIFESIVSTLK
ncbi:MAG: YlbE-like family protein [Bacilli bacterium]|nr:YlbE-like family protein [Bacilli bacterium]